MGQGEIPSWHSIGVGSKPDQCCGGRQVLPRVRATLRAACTTARGVPAGRVPEQEPRGLSQLLDWLCCGLLAAHERPHLRTAAFCSALLSEHHTVLLFLVHYPSGCAAAAPQRLDRTTADPRQHRGVIRA